MYYVQSATALPDRELCCIDNIDVFLPSILPDTVPSSAALEVRSEEGIGREVAGDSGPFPHLKAALPGGVHRALVAGGRNDPLVGLRVIRVVQHLGVRNISELGVDVAVGEVDALAGADADGEHGERRKDGELHLDRRVVLRGEGLGDEWDAEEFEVWLDFG
jgi:hypothetical protein